MKVHNRYENEHLLTAKQWAKKGRVLNDNATGEMMWSNQFCQQAYEYFDEAETHEATAEELAQYWKPIREEKNAKIRQARQKKKERERQEKLDLINQINKLNDTVYQLICKFNSVTQTYENIIAELSQNSPCTQEVVTTETIVIDTETTGLVAGVDELLQVSIIDDKGNTLYNQHIKPIKATEWNEAERINHISPDMVKDCPNIYEEIPKINAILRNAKTLIGYNTTGFDVEFLQCFGADFSNIENFVDIMLEFAPIYGEWSEYHESYKWQKLTTCADFYGYNWGTDTAHDSLADCRATLYCYEAICNKPTNEDNNNKL